MVGDHPNVPGAQGTYTIDTVTNNLTYGTPGQVYAWSYKASNGTSLSAYASGNQGLGSEKGSVTDSSGVITGFDAKGTTNAALMQYYSFRYTYASGDTYTGYGYHTYTANKSITNVALTSNVATITSAAHGYVVGDIVTVNASNDTFDGNYIITAVTTDTFSYAKTTTDVTSASATGTISNAYTSLAV